MYLFTLIKSDLIANDFSIERCRDIPMLCNLLKCVVPNLKQHVGSPLLLIKTSLRPHFIHREFHLEREEAPNFVLFDRILQAAMGLLDGG